VLSCPIQVLPLDPVQVAITIATPQPDHE